VLAYAKPDDLDGSSSDSIQTVTFGLDGVTYEIDLNDDNAHVLGNGLSDFIGSARRTGGRVKRGTPVRTEVSGPNGSGRNRDQTRAIREWAKNNGHDVSDRGRIPAAVIEDFESQAGKAAVKKKGK
jgi:hypothetical protein